MQDARAEWKHGPFCALCGACQQHDDAYCYDAEDRRHLWNRPLDQKQLSAQEPTDGR